MSSVVPPAASTYAFGDVVVDTRAHRVLRGGVEVPLEPKAYDVLLALLRAPGAVVSRDALLDAVWGHRHVTPAVLNRVIAMLRRALGDEAEHPHLIRTVHGTGYAFIGVLEGDRETGSRLRGSDGMGTAEAPPEAHAAGGGHVAHEDLEPVAAPPASPVTGRMRFYAVLGLVVAIALAATWTIAKRFPVHVVPIAVPPAGAPPAAAPSSSPTLALLPPRLDARDPELRALTFAYLDGLRDALARLPGVSVAGSESARIAVLREQEPSKVGRLLGVEYVLATTIAREAGSIALELALLHVADGATLWRERFVQPSAALFRTIGPVLDGVVGQVSSMRVVDPVLAVPESAQDLYWRGVVALQLEDSTEAIARFEQALAVEPRFAMAHVGIAHAWRNRALAREASLGEAAAKGHVAVARALEIDPELVPAYVAEALLLTMQWRSNEAEIPIRRARAIDPDNLGVLTLTANLAGYAGRPNEALAIRPRTAALDPLSPMILTLWGRDLGMAGRFDEARAKLHEALAIAPNSSFALDTETRLLAAYGRFDEALAYHARVAERSADLYAALTVATILTAFGDYDAAQAGIDGFAGVDLQPPAFAQTVMELFWAQRRFDDALAWIEGEGRTRVQDPWRSAMRARALALSGRRDVALAAYRAVFAETGNRELLASSVYALHVGVGELANWAVLEREAGAGDDAVADFTARLEAMAAGGFAMPVLEYYRAVAALLRDDVAEADAALGRAFARGWRDRIALDTDLAWAPYADAPWLRAHRATLDASLDAMRRAAEAGAASRQRPSPVSPASRPFEAE